MEENIFKMGVALIVVIFVITAIYCWSLFQILQRIPRDKQQFPSWFVWLFLIPWIGFIFQWVMLPFGIPNAFKKTFPTNQDVIRAADTLFKLGLGQVIFTTFSILLPIPPFNQISAILGLLLWIAYWVKIILFKKAYLNTRIIT